MAKPKEGEVTCEIVKCLDITVPVKDLKAIFSVLRKHDKPLAKRLDESLEQSAEEAGAGFDYIKGKVVVEMTPIQRDMVFTALKFHCADLLRRREIEDDGDGPTVGEQVARKLIEQIKVERRAE
jgi:hypothetical protein